MCARAHTHTAREDNRISLTSSCDPFSHLGYLVDDFGHGRESELLIAPVQACVEGLPLHVTGGGRRREGGGREGGKGAREGDRGVETLNSYLYKQLCVTVFGSCA